MQAKREEKKPYFSQLYCLSDVIPSTKSNETNPIFPGPNNIQFPWRLHQILKLTVCVSKMLLVTQAG